MIKVLISQPRGKENLVKTFQDLGVTLTDSLDSSVDLIIPTVDEELWLLSRMVSTKPRIMVNTPFVVDTCRDKAEFYRFCKRHGFDTPNTLHTDLIAKPRFGKGSRGIIKLDRSYIVQGYVDAPEISIDYFADWNGQLISLIPRYRMGITNGASTELKLADIDTSEIKRLGKELNLIGHNVIQGFYENSRLLFTEVNLRFGGGSHLTFEIFNSPKWLIEHL